MKKTRSQVEGLEKLLDAALVRDSEVKTRLKARSELLKQLSCVTSSTSSGSARVRSTHCEYHISARNRAKEMIVIEA